MSGDGREGRGLITTPRLLLAAMIVVAALIVAMAIIGVRRSGQEPRLTIEPAQSSPQQTATATNDTLVRCRTQTGTDDEACRAAWEESRRRFIGGD